MVEALTTKQKRANINMAIRTLNSASPDQQLISSLFQNVFGCSFDRWCLLSIEDSVVKYDRFDYDA